MSDTAERYRRLSDLFAATLAGVPDDGWSGQSPCEDWTARDVVGHVVATQGMFLGFVRRELGDGPNVEDDPAAAWDYARAKVQDDLDDPALASATFEGFTGPSTFEAAVDRFLCTDLVLHRWDLARASGEDVTIDAADMAHVREAMADLVDRMRGPGAFGPELDPPAGADEQTAFLAFFGRDAG
jgi:uncharacterized protein (TIGR03086 family)